MPKRVSVGVTSLMNSSGQLMSAQVCVDVLLFVCDRFWFRCEACNEELYFRALSFVVLSFSGLTLLFSLCLMLAQLRDVVKKVLTLHMRMRIGHTGSQVTDLYSKYMSSWKRMPLIPGLGNVGNLPRVRGFAALDSSSSFVVNVPPCGLCFSLVIFM